MKPSVASQFALLAGLPLVASVVLFLSPLVAQEKPSTEKPKGRLPAYYGQVVDEKQKTTIYTIQSKYAKDLDPLKEQMEKILADMKKISDKRDAEIEAVLTKEQKEKLDKLKSDAKGKGKKGSTEPSKEEEKKPE